MPRWRLAGAVEALSVVAQHDLRYTGRVGQFHLLGTDVDTARLGIASPEHEPHHLSLTTPQVDHAGPKVVRQVRKHVPPKRQRR